MTAVCIVLYVLGAVAFTGWMFEGEHGIRRLNWRLFFAALLWPLCVALIMPFAVHEMWRDAAKARRETRRTDRWSSPL